MIIYDHMNYDELTFQPRNVTKKHLAEKITDGEVKKLDKCYKQVTHPDWLRRTPSPEVRSVTTRLLSHNILLHPHFLKYQAEVNFGYLK